jgi:hypothetical protein
VQLYVGRQMCAVESPLQPNTMLQCQVPPVGYATYRIEKAPDAGAPSGCVDEDSKCSQWAAEVRAVVHPQRGRSHARHKHPGICLWCCGPLNGNQAAAGCCCRASAAGALPPCTPNAHCHAGPVSTVMLQVCTRGSALPPMITSLLITRPAGQTRADTQCFPQANYSSLRLQSSVRTVSWLAA